MWLLKVRLQKQIFLPLWFKYVVVQEGWRYVKTEGDIIKPELGCPSGLGILRTSCWWFWTAQTMLQNIYYCLFCPWLVIELIPAIRSLPPPCAAVLLSGRGRDRSSVHGMSFCTANFGNTSFYRNGNCNTVWVQLKIVTREPVCLLC